MYRAIDEKIRLFLDDVRIPTESGYAVVRSYNDAINFLQDRGCPDFISFDHDLGDADELTGLDVVKWMIERDLNNNGEFIPENFTYKVHSSNPPGADNIDGLLKSYLHHKEN